MDDVYGRNTLKAEDLPPNFRSVLTVERVTVQTFDDRDDKTRKEKKLVLHFVGKDKGLVLGVTTANMMAEIAKSRDYDYWPGKSVVLYRTMTDFAGKRVPALRLDHIPAGAVAAQNHPAPPPPPVDPARDDAGFQASDDDVPF